MRKEVIFVLLVLSAFILAGCTGISPESIAMLDSNVQRFLEDHPNAEIKVSLVRADIMPEMAETITAQCDVPLREADHWMVKVTDPDTGLRMTLWIEVETEDTVCVYQQGADGTIIEIEDETETDDETDVEDETDTDDETDDDTDDSTDDGSCVEEDTRCSPEFNAYDWCIDTDEDGDVEWALKEYCEDNQGCYAGECVEKSCEIGETRCSPADVDEGFDKCAYYDGKIQWLQNTYCKDNETCEEGACVRTEDETDDDVEVADEPMITIGDFEMNFDKIELSSGGDKVSKVILRMKNLSETQKDYRYDVLFQISKDGEIITTDSSKDSLVAYDVIDTEFDSYSLYTDSLTVGTYSLDAVVYNDGSNVPLKTLSKGITISPDAQTVIWGAKPVIEFDETESTTVRNMAVSFDKVELTSSGNDVYKANLRIENLGETQNDISYDLKFFILNEDGEIIDVSSNQNLTEYDLIGTSINYYSISNTYTFNPGTYTLMAKLFNDGSNVSNTYITKEIQIGPDAPSEVFSEREEVDFTPTTVATIAGSVEVSYDKVELASSGNDIYKAYLTMKNTGTSEKDISYDLKFFILNADKELIDSSSNQNLTEYDLSGSVTDYYSISNTYTFNPGTYTLMAKLFNDGSNVSNTYITKEIQIGPDAPSEQ